jgi:two-component system cell cycle response regulator
VIVLDLDHFKRVNDTHGHLAGDAVLKEVARRMAVGLRPYDTVGRYGGEEFVIVAPSCDREGASRLVERILTMIRSKPVDATECHVSVTASCGISISNPGKPLDPRDLMRMADEALYRAKDHGRNRAEFAVEPELIGSS